MLNETFYEWLDKKGYADRITEQTETIDTVEHATQQIGCSEAEIAKTLSFIVDEKPVMSPGVPVFFFFHKTGKGYPGGGKSNKGNYNRDLCRYRCNGEFLCWFLRCSLLFLCWFLCRYLGRP